MTVLCIHDHVESRGCRHLSDSIILYPLIVEPFYASTFKDILILFCDIFPDLFCDIFPEHFIFKIFEEEMFKIQPIFLKIIAKLFS